MKLCCLTIALMLCTSAPSTFAQTVVDQPNVKAVDVVTKPFSDLNLKKGEVPPILLDAREKPYSLVGPVPYTHLTLPTNREGSIPVGAAKQKTKNKEIIISYR